MKRADPTRKVLAPDHGVNFITPSSILSTATFNKIPSFPLLLRQTVIDSQSTHYHRLNPHWQQHNITSNNLFPFCVTQTQFTASWLKLHGNRPALRDVYLTYELLLETSITHPSPRHPKHVDERILEELMG